MLMSMLLFQAELELSQCVAVVLSCCSFKQSWTCNSVLMLLSMLLFQAELNLPQCVAVAEYVAVSGGAEPATVCSCS
jgi:hypothetical protein